MRDLVSVIIPTKNESDVLSPLLESLKNQTYNKIETIVVDNFSSDLTRSIAKKKADKLYLKGPERSAQRNYGALKAKGNYLLFLDSDMRLGPEVINECIKAISKTGIGGIVIPEISIGIGFWDKVKSFERSFYENTLNYNIDAARFFPKKIFYEVGGYDESITGPEDWDLSERVRKLGYQLIKISLPLTHKERISSLLKHAKKFYFYGLQSHRPLSKHNQLISSKTLHFLRPEFYKKWYRLIIHPILTAGMVILLSTQLLAGGLGLLVGKITNK